MGIVERYRVLKEEIIRDILPMLNNVDSLSYSEFDKLLNDSEIYKKHRGITNSSRIIVFSFVEEGLLEFTDELRIRLPKEARKKYSEVE